MTFVITAAQTILRLLMTFLGGNLQLRHGLRVFLGIIECLTIPVEFVGTLCTNSHTDRQRHHHEKYSLYHLQYKN